MYRIRSNQIKSNHITSKTHTILKSKKFFIPLFLYIFLREQKRNKTKIEVTLRLENKQYSFLLYSGWQANFRINRKREDNKSKNEVVEK